MKSGELFAGVGGLGMAVDAVFGSTPAWFAEVDAAPSKVLAHRYPDVPNYGDVTAVDWKTTPRVNILAGGFPCQDVSLAGRRKGMGEGTRSGLWSEFAKAIDEIRPDWVVIENVRGLLSANAAGDVEPCPWCLGDDPKQHALRAHGAVLGDLADLGFHATWTGLRASDIGAPHGRFRVFILAWPAENTGSGRGRRWAVASGRGESAGADVAVDGSDTRDDRAPETVALMPTPKAGDADFASPRTSGRPPEKSTHLSTRLEFTLPEWIDAKAALLPTPAAMNPNDGEGTETWLARRERVKVTANNGNGMGMPLSIAVQLLPTPGASVATKGGPQHPEKRRAGGHQVNIDDAAVFETSGTSWGPYEAAIRRWEPIIGRPMAPPVRYDGKGGKPRLNPELTEDMMGWPKGWVTDPAIGLTRAEQLRACGNGVVPQQAIAALCELLDRPGVPERSAA